MNDTEDLWLQIIGAMEAQRQKGLKKYGRPVTADDAVDWVTHSLQEQLDDLVYTAAIGGVIEKLQRRIEELENDIATMRDAAMDRYWD